MKKSRRVILRKNDSSWACLGTCQRLVKYFCEICGKFLCDFHKKHHKLCFPEEKENPKVFKRVKSVVTTLDD